MAIGKDDLPIHREFVAEARGHLATAESQILALEANPQDADALDAIFRCFHTIKGVAGFLNLTQIGALSHAAEDLLNLVRNREVALRSSDVDLVLQAIDQMKLLIGALADAVEHERPLFDLPGLDGLLQRLESCAHEQRSPVETEDATACSAPTDLPELVIASSAAPAVEPAAAPLSTDAAGTAPKQTPAIQASSAGVSVSTERLDALIDTVGELVIAQSMVSRDVGRHVAAAADRRLVRNMAQLGKITRTLQELSMSMRMVPIQGAFRKVARLARDLARKAGKQVEFTATGSETELDRNLVEAVSDPLVHMVRNAVDHGIESAPDRAAAGKDPTGHIRLSAWQQAGCIVIQLGDDGKGLDREKILRKANEAGIVAPGAQLSDQEVFRLSSSTPVCQPPRSSPTSPDEAWAWTWC